MNLDRYREHGYHVEYGLVSRFLCGIAVKIATDLATDADYAPLYMPHRRSNFLLTLLRSAPIVAIAEQLVGGEASGLGSEYFFHKPGTRGFTAHQDNVWVQAPAGQFVHAWVALSEVTPKNGGLVFWPGSHRSGLFPTRAIDEDAGPGQNPGARRMTIDVPADYEPIDIRVNPGDVVFWDSHLIHASRDNMSDEFRYALLLTYIRKGAKFNPGSRQKRTEIALYASTVAA